MKELWAITFGMYIFIAIASIFAVIVWVTQEKIPMDALKKAFKKNNH